MELNDETLLNLLANLGSSAIFLYLYFQRDKDVKEKDKRIEVLADKAAETTQNVALALEKNTTAIDKNADAIKANTAVQDKLLTRIEDFLLK